MEDPAPGRSGAELQIILATVLRTWPSFRLTSLAPRAQAVVTVKPDRMHGILAGNLHPPRRSTPPGVAMGADHQIAFFLRESARPEPERRAAALKGLGRIGRGDHAGVLVGGAGDPDPRVRAAAALALGRLGIPAAGRDVLPLLMGDADPDVRRRASVAAVRLGLDGPAVTGAFARLLSDPDHHMRINALDGLTALGVPGDAIALAALLGDPDFTVWGRARTLLYTCREDPAVRAELIRAARRGTGAARARALEWLPERCTEQLLDSLLTGLHDPSPAVRIEAARRLFHVEQQQVQDKLAAVLRSEEHPEAAAGLLRGLGGRGDDRVTEPAVRWLRDPVAGPSAARALGTVDSGTAAAHLREALSDETLSPRTRAAAAAAIGTAGRWDAVWLLLSLLCCPSWTTPTTRYAPVCSTAWRHVSRTACAPGNATPWPGRWQNTWPPTRSTSGAHATRSTASPRPCPTYGGSRTAPSGEVLAAALSLLDGDDPDNEHTRHDLRRFLRGLDDPHEAVRYQAVLGLQRWAQATGSLPPDSGRTRDRLTALTEDTSPRLRQAATRLLGVADSGPP
ncbi:HEAT repeat domain-containing protein [Streptomyces massasporeus]|uniref:HEAT repeat domain-containing protein n=1 Tax=Streptomyces massasporeus TaxID=67324 RepID=UPI00381BA5D3